ncbi:universal stress protein [Halovenus salina]|uniref:Universal stress protein n=1 Tax=Halovenus salina TaxID=1510225 RepID=A0ABD5W642_9EURY|nr:universal stress protein [Halovenus salina]
MERALAVVEPKEATKELVAEAGELANAVGAELLLLHVTTEEEFQNRRSTIENVAGLDAGYNVESARSGAEQFAEKIGMEVLDDVEFTAMGRIGDPQDTIMTVADEENADHIFIHGKQRSPTGKAVFGDTAQAIILGFDGPVTVTTGDDE